MEVKVYSSCAQVKHLIDQAILNLPTSVNVDSIFVTNEDNEIVPFTYDFPFSHSIGSQVKVVKGKLIHIGKLISYSEDKVGISYENQILYIKNYDIISFVEEFHYPVLKFDDDENKIINYLIGDITWKCLTTACIENGEIIFRIAALVTNKSEICEEIKLSLIAGDVNLKRTNNFITPRAVMMTAANNSISNNPKDDFVEYDIGEQKLNPKTMIELDSFSAKSKHIYIHHTDQDFTEYAYAFISPEFIPVSSVNAYKCGTFIGNYSLKEVNKNEEVVLVLGKSSSVQCKTFVEPVSVSGSGTGTVKTVTENLTIYIKNYKKQDVTLIVKHFIGDNSFQKCSCSNAVFIEGVLEFTFLIKEGALNEKFVCSITTLQRH